MTRVRDEYRQNQSPAQALAHLRLVAGAPIARPALPSLEIIFRFLFRCSPKTDMAAFTDPRRSDRRVFAAELPMASCEMVSAAAIDRADTLTTSRSLAKSGCRAKQSCAA